MTIRNLLLGTTLVLALAAPALGQTPPAPSPAPSPPPQPSPTPAPQPSPNPAPQPSPTPAPKYHSPFNGDRDPNHPEAKDFDALLDLYDVMKDAEAALKSAENCKTGIEAAKAALQKATRAFNEALDEYAIGWNPKDGTPLTEYHRNFPRPENHDKTHAFSGSVRILLDMLAKADKKSHVVKACPVPEPPPSTPPPAPPPDDVPHVEGDLGGPVDEWMMGPPIDLGGEYASLNPSDDDSSNLVGFAATAFVPLGDGWRLDGKGGYDNISGRGPSADFWHLSGALSSDRLLRFGGDSGAVLTGIDFGVQQISTGGFSSTTYDVGGFVSVFPSPRWNVNIDAGGNWSSFNRDGFHVGGGATFYPCPRWAIDGGLHYTDFGSFRETDFAGGLRYLTPYHGVTLGLSETYSTFGPGSGYMNTVWLSLSVPVGGTFDGLAERDRGGRAVPAFAPPGLR